MAKQPTERDSVFVRSEIAGQTLDAPAVPWCADALIVEVTATLPRRTILATEFTLALPGQPPRPAETIARIAKSTDSRITFRAPVPTSSVTGEILWNHHRLASVTVTVQSARQYLTTLSFKPPTVILEFKHSKLQAQASAWIPSQVGRATAALAIMATGSLLPLLGLTPTIQIPSGKQPVVQRPILTLASLQGRQLLWLTDLPRPHATVRDCILRWQLDGIDVAEMPVRYLRRTQLEKSVRVSGGRWAPLRDIVIPVPQYLLVSMIPGVAAEVELRSQIRGKEETPLVHQHLLIDRPTPLIDAGRAYQTLPDDAVAELFLGKQLLASLPRTGLMAAQINSEGGFQSPHSVIWSPMAEEELQKKLLDLL